MNHPVSRSGCHPSFGRRGVLYELGESAGYICRGRFCAFFVFGRFPGVLAVPGAVGTLLADEPVLSFLYDLRVDLDEAIGVRKEAKRICGKSKVRRFFTSPVRKSAVGRLVSEKALISRLEKFSRFSFYRFRDASRAGVDATDADAILFVDADCTGRCGRRCPTSAATCTPRLACSAIPTAPGCRSPICSRRSAWVSLDRGRRPRPTSRRRSPAV